MLWLRRVCLATTLRGRASASAFASLHPSRLCAGRAMCTSATLYAPHDVPAALSADLRKIIQHDRLVLFLTGTPQEPRCRFTNQLVHLMDQLGVHYSYFNILEDDEVCEGLKQFSDWPTYPQVYLDGELVGGYDICKSMVLDGSLPRLLKEKKLLD